MLNVLSTLEIELVSYDLVAVHRLGKFIQGANRSVIIRFINRKEAYKCLKRGNKLADVVDSPYKNLYFTENLCPTNKKVFNYLFKLKKTNKIHKVWSYSGDVYFKIKESDDPIKVYFIEDVDNYLEPEVDQDN